jgi:hypothetical protein
MKKSLCAAVAAAAVTAIALPASVTAKPPITPPEGSTCTFAKGHTTCIRSIGTAFAFETEPFPFAGCASGWAAQRTEGSETTTTTWVFRGMHQLGEPTSVTTTTGPTTTTRCVAAPSG